MISVDELYALMYGDAIEGSRVAVQLLTYRAGDPRPASAGRRRNPPMDAMQMREAADAVQDREDQG